MKINSKIFYKLFGLMLFGFTMVFAIQLIAKNIFFDNLYIKNIHNKNITEISEVAKDVENGIDLFDSMYRKDLLNINAYITDSDFVVIVEDYFPDDYQFAYSIEDFLEKDSVYFQVIEESDGNSMYTIYYKELENGNFLFFEQYLFGLVTANETLNIIDIYIVVGMFIFLFPYTYWYSRKFSKPLIEMNTQVNALSNFEFLPELKVSSKDEMGKLTESINKVSKSLEESINKLKEDIEFEQYKDKKRRELIASLSHELKTPISALRAVIEGMKDNVGKFKDRDKYLLSSLEYLYYMETLSKDLIDAINIESSTVKLSSHSIEDIYKQSIRFVEHNVNSKKQSIITDIGDYKVLVNKDMIQRVFINLINNGSKYSKYGATIRVFTSVVDDKLSIGILNTDSFINSGDLTHLFEPFYRVEKSRSKETGGSGLGLFIIKSILDGHNSNYEIKNTVDGVLFTFTLEIDTKVAVKWHNTDISF